MAPYTFIIWLLTSSFMGAVLAFLILLTRTILGDWISARWRHLLWLLLVLKLAVPCIPESSLSVFNIFAFSIASRGSGFHAVGNRAKVHGERAGVSFADAIDAGEDYSLAAGDDAAKSRGMVLFWLWLTGAVAIAAHAVFLNFRLWRVLKESRPVREEHIFRVFDACKRVMKISGRAPVLHESAAIRIPMAIGISKPHVLLPTEAAQKLSRNELRFTLLHELAHLKRRDLYFNWAVLVLQIVHWFNPVVWYAFRNLRQDQELACDAHVLSTLRPSEYLEYGAALISFLEKCSSSCSLTAAKLVSSKARIRQRVSVIASFRKESTRDAVVGILLIVMLGCFVLTNPKTTAATSAERPQQNVGYENLSRYFEPFDGSFILLDLENERYQIYNERKSHERVSPDSTYKLVSALAGLESGALASEDSELKWDGTVYPFDPWNKDQTLHTAMVNSVSWFFQKVDATTGIATIGQYLKQISYGNYDISGGLASFWLESSLKISPAEQVEVLKNFYNCQLPFSRANIDIIKKNIKICEMDGAVLSGKTGTGIVDGKSINGWFVGYVEKGGNAYIFAANIQGADNANGVNAKGIVLSILKDKKLL